MPVFYTGSSADDGEANYGGSIQNVNTLNYCGRVAAGTGNPDRAAYWRIPGISIPRYSTITWAGFYFYVNGIGYNGVLAANLYLENAGNPAQISSYADWNARPLLGSSGQQTINAAGWFGYDVTAALQTVVNYGGWVNNNSAIQAHLRGGYQSRGQAQILSHDYGQGYSYLNVVFVPPAPAAPTGFAGSVQGPTSVLWSWNNVADEDGFRVLNEGLASISGNLAANTLSWLETGLTPGTSYTRRVQAYNAGGTANSSPDTKVTSLPAPAAPTGFNGVAQSPTSILWTWDNVSYEDGFRVLDQGSSNISGDLAADTLSWLETGLTPGTSYTRSVQAYNGTGVGTSTQSAVSTIALAGYPQVRLVI